MKLMVGTPVTGSRPLADEELVVIAARVTTRNDRNRPSFFKVFHENHVVLILYKIKQKWNHIPLSLASFYNSSFLLESLVKDVG